MNDVDNKYKEYANAVLSGKVVACKYIKQACKRYLSWLDKYEFREDKVDRVINFIQKLRHNTGKHANKPFLLEPWQKFIVYNIFGFYKDNGTRLVNNVFISMSRKNGKTAFIAAIALYCLIADEEMSAECDFLANNAKQAYIAFSMTSNFLASIDPKGKYFGRYRDKITFDKTKSFIQVLSSEASGLDGFNSSMWVLDECHAQPNSKLFDVMQSSQGMRENPIGIIITTAGFLIGGFCHQYQNMCQEVLSGVKEDDSLFAAIFTLDEEDNWDDENVWIKANPNLDITVTKEYIRRQINSAKINPSLETSVRTKTLNCWVSSANTWILNDLILDYTEKVDLSKFKDEICYMGLDLASVSDLTALSVMVPNDDKFYFKTFYYLPESCLKNNINSQQYIEWHRRGFLTLTSGNVCDYDVVLKDILKIFNQMTIHKIAYDQYNSTQFAINATSEGLPLVPFSQALWSFNKCTKEFERSLKLGRIVIDNNPITRWCFQNVALKFDYNENCKPIKGGNSNGKIDGVISMLEALGIYLEQPHYSTQIYTN